MRIYKTKWFRKWAAKEGISDTDLRQAISEIENGLVEANLGGSVYKKRIAVNGRGKRGSFRTILAYKYNEVAFFVFGFAKNQRENVSSDEKLALKMLAKELLSYTGEKTLQALTMGKLFEVL